MPQNRYGARHRRAGHQAVSPTARNRPIRSRRSPDRLESDCDAVEAVFAGDPDVLTISIHEAGGLAVYGNGEREEPQHIKLCGAAWL
jgi:hypothetical protein